MKICLGWADITASNVQNGLTRRPALPHTPRASLTRGGKSLPYHGTHCEHPANCHILGKSRVKDLKNPYTHQEAMAAGGLTWVDNGPKKPKAQEMEIDLS